MGAIAWTRDHLPHRHHQAGQVATPQHHRWRGRELAASFAAGYALVWALLLITARGLFDMSSREALAFAFGVTSYVALFAAFIAGLAWSVGGARMDTPDRR